MKSFSLFFEALKPLAASPPKHLVLIQTPASFKANLEKLKNFLKAIPKTFLYAFEFRHWSWFCEETYQILRKFNTAVVLADSPIKQLQSVKISQSQLKSAITNSSESNQFQPIPTERLWPYVNVDTASFFDIRFHGSKRLFASS